MIICVFGKDGFCSRDTSIDVYLDGTRLDCGYWHHLRRWNWIVLEYRRGHAKASDFVFVSGMFGVLNSTYITTNTGSSCVSHFRIDEYRPAVKSE